MGEGSPRASSLPPLLGWLWLMTTTLTVRASAPGCGMAEGSGKLPASVGRAGRQQGMSWRRHGGIGVDVVPDATAAQVL